MVRTHSTCETLTRMVSIWDYVLTIKLVPNISTTDLIISLRAHLIYQKGDSQCNITIFIFFKLKPSNSGSKEDRSENINETHGKGEVKKKSHFLHEDGSYMFTGRPDGGHNSAFFDYSEIREANTAVPISVHYWFNKSTGQLV